jgi:hypothetical protein
MAGNPLLFDDGTNQVLAPVFGVQGLEVRVVLFFLLRPTAV